MRSQGLEGSQWAYTMLTEVRSESSRRIRTENLRKGRDYSPRRGKILVPRSDGLVNALQTSLTKDHYVLVTPKSTSMQYQFTKGNSHMPRTSVTSQKSTQTSFLTSTASLEDSLVRLFQSLESEEDLKIPEGRSFDLARILRAKKPRLFVFENVKGLLSHDKGNTFKTIIATVDELGYDAQWQVLNSKDFGVPQNRERIIIVGHSRNSPRPEVFPLGGTSGKDIIQLNQPVHSNDRLYNADGVSPALNTMQGGLRQPFITTQPKIRVVGNRNPSGRGISGNVYETENSLAPTISAGGSNPNRNRDIGYNNGAYITKSTIRRLTPLECERLQAFPDNWTKYGKDGELISDTQRYKMAGNAVTTNVIQAVFERLV